MMHIISNDAPHLPPITELWAYLTVEGEVESVCGGFDLRIEMARPFIFTTLAEAERFEPRVAEMVRRTGRTIKLFRFTAREELRTIHGGN